MSKKFNLNFKYVKELLGRVDRTRTCKKIVPSPGGAT